MLAKLSVKRPVTMIMALIAVILLGFVSIFTLPQALMPDIEMPYAIAMVTYGGAGPEEIDELVTTPMEAALATVEGMKSMSSVSAENMAYIIMEFNMDTDLDFATLDMREKLSMLQSVLPEDASDPTIMKVGVDSLPVMQLYISSDMDISRLNSFIENNVSPDIERLAGVASIDVMGATESIIKVEFDQDKLNGYGLSMSTVGSMIAAENISYPSGTISNGDTEVTVKTFGEFQNIREIEDMPITLSDLSVITLKDVAKITETETESTSISRIDGNPAIGLSISKTSDANVVELSNAIIKTVERLEEEHAGDIQITVGYDQADFVRLAITSVGKTAVQGALLAIVVIFLFLRNFRSTMVIAISIPASVLATFCVMKALGMTMNMLTMGSLTLAIGMVVDNSVVVLENIFRRNKMGLNAHDAAIEGSKEVGLAVAASTLTSVVVYLPIALSGGMVGMLFRDFSFTIVAALGCSLLVSLTVVPMLASNLLDNTISEDYIRVGKKFYRYRLVVKFTEFIDEMVEGYRGIIRKCLNNRSKVIIVFLIFFILSGSLVAIVGTELIPPMDEGGFTVTVGMPQGTSLEEYNDFMADIEEYILQLPETEHVSITVGESSSLLSSSNIITANLVPSSKRSRDTEEVMRDVKHHFKDLAGAEVTYAITDSLGMTALAGADLTINVYGEDAKIVASDTEALYKELQKLDCISDIETDVAEGAPEVRVKINRSTAALYGLTTYQVASELSSAISGTTYSRLNVDGETIDIELSLTDKYKQSVEDMKAIQISSPLGMTVPVGQVAEFEFANSPVAINKTNQEIISKIDLTFKDSVDVAEGTDAATAVADKFLFSEGVRYDTGGMMEQMLDYFQDLVLALVVSIALVFIVMAAQFESVALPFMVMFSIPFAMSGAFLALFLTGQKLSIIAMIGFIMLVGIVVNNAILLVEFISQNKEQMGRDDAITEAGAVRMRPILMTTVTTIVGMIPMALGIGEATELMIPMAVSLIGGLIASTAVSLFIVPVMYSVIDDWEIRRAARKAAVKKLNMYRETLWLAKEAEKREERAVIKAEKDKEREDRRKEREERRKKR